MCVFDLCEFLLLLDLYDFSYACGFWTWSNKCVCPQNVEVWDSRSIDLLNPCLSSLCACAWINDGGFAGESWARPEPLFWPCRLVSSVCVCVCARTAGSLQPRLSSNGMISASHHCVYSRWRNSWGPGFDSRWAQTGGVCGGGGCGRAGRRGLQLRRGGGRGALQKVGIVISRGAGRACGGVFIDRGRCRGVEVLRGR